MQDHILKATRFYSTNKNYEKVKPSDNHNKLHQTQ